MLADSLTPPAALRRRMAEVLGLDPAQVLPVRGRAHGLQVLFRHCALAGFDVVGARLDPVTQRLAAINRIEVVEDAPAAIGLRVVSLAAAPRSVEDLHALVVAVAPGLLVLEDERGDLGEGALPPGIGDLGEMLVLKKLGVAAALVGPAAVIAALEAVLEPDAFPDLLAREALANLSPSRLVLAASRARQLAEERGRVIAALAHTAGVRTAEVGGDDVLRLELADIATVRQAFQRFGVEAEFDGAEAHVMLGDAARNNRLLVALGAPGGHPPRRGEVIRDTKETRITCVVDLDGGSEVTARTGIGFYDHMLEQVAFHGGFSLTLACDGDLEIDGHHTIEDCAIAFGQGLKAALGDRRGIARFGFLLPMDETEAKVSIDLGGRPFSVFEGEFRAPLIGDYPTEMTAHVFRSLSESLAASIHVAVTGQNDHHKTEACFKALGRALRQAVRVEGDVLPSTKGVI